MRVPKQASYKVAYQVISYYSRYQVSGVLFVFEMMPNFPGTSVSTFAHSVLLPLRFALGPEGVLKVIITLIKIKYS